MKKHVLISIMLFFAVFSTILMLSGSASAQVVYARVELENIDQDMGPTWDNEEADLFIRLYSNSACTIPYFAPVDMEVYVRCDYSWSDIFQTGSNFYISRGDILSGDSEVFYGRVVLDGNDYWGGYDPGSPHIWTNTVLTYEISLGSGYYPAPTVFN